MGYQLEGQSQVVQEVEEIPGNPEEFIEDSYFSPESYSDDPFARLGIGPT